MQLSEHSSQYVSVFTEHRKILHVAVISLKSKKKLSALVKKVLIKGPLKYIPLMT
jgi:hypothetical protein